MRSHKTQLQKGQVMIMATVFFVLIVTALMLAIAAMTATTQELSNQYLESRKSFYIAEAGLESALYDILNGDPLSAAPTIDGVRADVDIIPEGDEERITSTAEWNGVIRTVEARISTGTTTEILSWKESR